MLVDNGKEKLIEVMNNYVSEVSDNREWVTEIKEELMKYGITGGRIENILSDVYILKEADLREVTLVTEQFFNKTRILELDPTLWFTENELENAVHFDKTIFNDKEDVDSPIIFENTQVVGNGVFATVITPAMIAELMKSQDLYYDFDIQRQPKKQKQGNLKPTVFKKNVKEIRGLLLNGQLISTTLAFNARSGSNKNGEELSYDSETGMLTVMPGTRLAFLDGYHRSLASEQAHQIDPDIEFNFLLMITNFTTAEAQQYQAQLAQASPFTKSRVIELKANRLADRVVQLLRTDSELKNKITSQQMPNYTAGELVSYMVISNAIEREFQMKSRLDTTKVSKHLGEFFEYLIGENQEVFLFKGEDKSTLMKYNKMFAGYIALAARMQRESIAMDQLQDILNSIDFSRDNKLWNEIGITDSEGKIKNTADEKKIANYFKTIKI